MAISLRQKELSLELELLRRQLQRAYQRKRTLCDGEIYQLSTILDQKILEYMKKEI